MYRSRNIGHHLEYYLDYCKARRIFHPKFILLTYPEGGKLIIGSANLTEYDWLKAGQLLISIEYDISKPDNDTLSIFRDIKGFLEQLIENEILKSPKHKSKIHEMFNEIPWLKTIEKLKTSKKTRLLHNLRTPILEQVFNIIGDEKISEVSILSPFYDVQNSIIKEFYNKGCNKFEIYLQPEKVIGFQKNEIKKISKKKTSIKIMSVQFKPTFRTSQLAFNRIYSC